MLVQSHDTGSMAECQALAPVVLRCGQIGSALPEQFSR
jgi:hypothetical protein